MKFFSFLAEPYFKTSPSGERLFLGFGGPWTWPYIIPDQATEKRLLKKYTWFLGISFISAVLIANLVVRTLPKIIDSPLWFSLYLAAFISPLYVAYWLIFRKDLSKLKRASKRISLHDYYLDQARRLRTSDIIFGIVGSLIFVGIGSYMIKGSINPFLGWFLVLFFMLCGLAWGYTLFLKNRDQ